MTIQLRSFLLILILSVTVSESSYAADSQFRDEWIVRLQVEKLQRQFVYRGSSLDKVAKVTVDYFKEDEPDKKTLYEMLWFNDGMPIGLERKSDYKVPIGKSTKIQIENKKKETSPETEKAIADAILRISLDAYIKRTPIVSIRVPEESFQGIVDAMKKLNCVESQARVDEGNDAIMNFPIETVKDGPFINLYYY